MDENQQSTVQGSSQAATQAFADILSAAGILILVISATSNDGRIAIPFLGLALCVVGGFLRFRH